MRLSRKSAVASIVMAVVVVVAIPAAMAVDPDPVNNDPPDIVLPATLSTGVGVPISFAPVVSDPDEHLLDTELEIDISDLDGVGGRSPGDYGSFTWGGGTNVTSDVSLAPIADQNIALATFTFTPAPGFAGTARIVFEIDDQGNVGIGGTLSRTRFVLITVAEPGDAAPLVNDAPDIALPSALTTPVDTPISFAPTVSDVDAGTHDTELEIDVSDLDGPGGLSPGDYGTFTWGGGTGVVSDISLTPIATQNADLATFTFVPAPGFTGLARIVFEIDDQGNSGSEFPPNVLSRTRFVNITVEVPADLSVTKTADQTATAGETLDYELIIANDGPAASNNATLSDTLPEGTTFVSITQNSGPTFDLEAPAVGDGGTVTATVASLAPGESASFSLTVMVETDVADGAEIVNEASVSGGTIDADDSDNTDEATTTVEVAPDEDTTTTTSSMPGSDDPEADGALAVAAASGQPTGASGILPVTGASIAVLAGVAVCLIGTGMGLSRRRRREAR